MAKSVALVNKFIIQIKLGRSILRSRVGLGDFREKIICKHCKNEATSKILHRVNSLICTPNK